MKIQDHRLILDDGSPAAFEETDKMSGQLEHRYLVMHYTAGSSAASAIRTLTDPAVKASAHLVIAGDGEITQLVPFDRVAWHAGVSSWQGLTRLNGHSIGIELDNAGPLTPQGDKWRAWFGRLYDRSEVFVARHKNEDRERGWHAYPEAQLEAAIAVSALLVQEYGLIDVVGHDDIAPGRKSDPGPAFPMESFRARVMGRQSDAPEHLETTVFLNIRQGPGTGHERLEASPLAPGTRLNLLERQGIWHLVEVLDAERQPVQNGWVHGHYVRPVA